MLGIGRQHCELGYAGSLMYVMFTFDPKHASFWERREYEGLRLLFGECPPHSTLTYVWASRDHRFKYIRYHE